MKLTIEFESEWWRVRAWWHRRLCAWFGHPRFETRKGSPYVAVFSFGMDSRPRCVRCGVPDPSLPVPEPPQITYTWETA